MLNRVALGALLLITLATIASAEVPQTTANLVLVEKAISSVGHAALNEPECVFCGLWGEHRLEVDGTAWTSFGRENPSEIGDADGVIRYYDGTVEEATKPGNCYKAYIRAESASGLGQYRTPDEKCEPDMCALSLAVSGDGSINGTPAGTYTCGIDVSLEAQPNPGSSFAGWTGSITTAGSSLSFVLDANKQLTAKFEPIQSSPPDPGDPCASQPDGSTNCTPILINLTNEPWELTGLDDPVLFDMGGRGHPVLVGWTSRNAQIAFLALDRNRNGIIDSGAELFGNATRLRNGDFAPNGFLALAEFDENRDGRIDGSDGVWNDLLLWTDSDHNGLTGLGEVQNLSGSAVHAISLTAHWTGRRDQHGNMFSYKGSADFGGAVRPIYDVWFVVGTN